MIGQLHDLVASFVVILTLTLLCSCLIQKDLLNEGEVWQKMFTNISIVLLVTQVLQSSFLRRPVANVH